MRTQTLVPAASVNVVGRRGRYSNAVYYVVLGLWALVTIFIFLWLVESSFKTNPEVFASPWAIPSEPLQAAIHNYGQVWGVFHMGIYLTNSVIVTVVSVVLVIAVSAPAAYALSRVQFPGNTFITYYFIAGMGLPLQLILVPLYVLLVQLHLVNTLQGLIVSYVAISIPFTILLLTGFFRTLPTELEDAAAVDGCSEFGIFWSIMMPIATPGLLTAAIFNFVSIWNEFLLALLIINADSLRTMPLGLYSIRTTMQYTSDWASLFAAVVSLVIPAFLVYLALSDRIMAGLTLGSNR